jgi:hypothetical protein
VVDQPDLPPADLADGGEPDLIDGGGADEETGPDGDSGPLVDGDAPSDSGSDAEAGSGSDASADAEISPPPSPALRRAFFGSGGVLKAGDMQMHFSASGLEAAWQM